MLCAITKILLFLQVALRHTLDLIISFATMRDYVDVCDPCRHPARVRNVPHC